jgi:diacylglycerol kinase family enzyme
LAFTIIANPVAGGFEIPRRWKKHRSVLQTASEQAAKNPARKVPALPSCMAVARGGEWGSRGFLFTGRAGDADIFAHHLAKEVEEDALRIGVPFHLLVVAGGDGTGLETLRGFVGLSDGARKNLAVVRLPMGTGNDGSDAWELDAALERLLCPVTVEFKSAVRLITATAGKGPFFAFNILSVGLDAFVTHMTNTMKHKFPGDSYKLWIDIASLLYDRFYKVDKMHLEVYDKAGTVIKTLWEKFLLIAMGISGHRTYGAHKKILPDERNVCAIHQMPLLRKIAYREYSISGVHVNNPETIMFNASRLVINSVRPILAQTDGEAILLEPRDFPITLELTAPLIPVLLPAK